jgi:hypothetical protein
MMLLWPILQHGEDEYVGPICPWVSLYRVGRSVESSLPMPRHGIHKEIMTLPCRPKGGCPVYRNAGVGMGKGADPVTFGLMVTENAGQ